MNRLFDFEQWNQFKETFCEEYVVLKLYLFLTFVAFPLIYVILDLIVIEKSHVGEAVYFSVITITTTGYGDIQPTFSAKRFVAATEALSGVLILGVYLASRLGRRSVEPASDEEETECENESTGNSPS
ncbi:MAG: potassium channel family protein [Planctomycetota bacterium]|nr:potassium channel family protein [Planctomycetota bacterium]